MKAVNATYAKNRFGEMLDTSLTTPVPICRHGRVVAVLVSADEFCRGTSSPDDTALVLRALADELDGYITPEEFEALKTTLAEQTALQNSSSAP